MNHHSKSCGVAHPTQRNSATTETSATVSATPSVENWKKPASIQELRAQLKAQQSRNRSQNVMPEGFDQGPHSDDSCAVALPSDCNNATHARAVGDTQRKAEMIRDFMEVDGMTFEEAQAWEAQSVASRPADEWIAMIQELDAVINHYCSAKRVSRQARDDMLATRMNQSLASIPETLDWFRKQLNER